MSTREQIQRMILDRLERHEEVTVSWDIIRDILDDPNENPIGAFGVSMNEAVMLAGGRRPKNSSELFEQWCADNDIEWLESPLRFDHTFRKSAKERMRDLLIKVASQALRWRDVERVEIGFELSHRFENNGWDGRVDLRLSDGRRFGYILSSYVLQRTQSPDGLIAEVRHAFDRAMAKEAQL